MAKKSDRVPGQEKENSGVSDTRKVQLITGIVGLLAAVVKLIDNLLHH